MSIPRAWLTPDTPPTAALYCRRLHYPQTEAWDAIISGAILSLAEIENWEAFGTMTPAEAAETSWVMWQRFIQESNVCMLGTIFPYVTALPPDGSLLCDGATYLRVDYPDLYSLLDATFIIDADSFFVPDLLDRTVVGAGGTYLTNDAAGLDSVTLSIAELAVHSHTDLGHTHVEGIAVPGAPAVVGPVPTALPAAGVTGLGFANIQTAGGDVAHENRMPFRALPMAILAR